ncbi:type IV secretion system protein [Nitratireductor sp. GCM10026969]|uniref:type IV secretion system protein n=1 Tax=Nitratireductor sp. GCM10026969 TaxID=3252645 RepID=UPI0036156CB5
MENFLTDVLGKVDEAGGSFSEQAYTFIGAQIVPLLTALVVLYVAFYGVQLVTGTASIGVGEMTGRLVRMIAILALVANWHGFDVLFFGWLDGTPEQVGRALLQATLSRIDDPVGALSEIWNTANIAATAFAAQTGYEDGLPSLVSFLFILVAGAFVGVALAILFLAKVMLWVLVGTAPIFIACMLFEQTRGYGRGWLNQVLVYVLTPMFVYVVTAFLVIAMEPSLNELERHIALKDLQLSDFAVFVLLCIAGAIVLAQVQLHAHGIVRGIETGIARGLARATGRFPARWMAEAAWERHGPRRNVSSVYTGSTENMQAMQNRISANSMPL